MKKTLGMLTVLLSMNAFGFEISESLKEACSKGCTPEMKEIHNDFLNSSTGVSTQPAAYSGQCYVLSSKVNPNSNHFTTVLFDKNEKGTYMAGVSSNYTNGNDYASLSFQDLKDTIAIFEHRVGKISQQLTLDKTVTSNVVVQDWQLKRGTWIRQDLATKDLLVIRYNSAYEYNTPATEFCRLKVN